MPWQPFFVGRVRLMLAMWSRGHLLKECQHRRGAIKGHWRLLRRERKGSLSRALWGLEGDIATSMRPPISTAAYRLFLFHLPPSSSHSTNPTGACKTQW